MSSKEIHKCHICLYFTQKMKFDVLRSNKRKWLHIKDSNKGTIFRRDIDRCRLHRWPSDVNIRLMNEWSTSRLPIEWKSDLFDKIKRHFFQDAAVSILLFRYTMLIQAKHIDKELNGYYARKHCTVLNKSWTQHLHKNSRLATCISSHKPFK